LSAEAARSQNGRHDPCGRFSFRQTWAQWEDWLRERGVCKVQLMIRETNVAIAKFYERIGYKTEPRVVMSKWLPL
jgi:hypothetical protein